MNYIDEDGYNKIIEKIGQAESDIEILYNRMLKDDYKHYEFFMEGAWFLTFRSEVTTQYGRIKALKEALGKNLQDWKEYQEQSRIEFGQINTESDYNSSFGNYMDQYNAYQYPSNSIAVAFVNSRGSFTGDYNDLYSFMKTDAYKQAEKWLMHSELTNYTEYATTWFGNGYGEELLEASLGEILTTLPGVTVVDNLLGNAKTLCDLIDSYWGCSSQELYESIEKWFEKLYAGDPNIIEAFASGDYESIEWVRMLLGSFKDNGSREVVKKCLGLIFNENTASFFKNVDNAGKWVQGAKEYFDIFAIALTNYTQQKSYLTAVKESLLAAGYNGGSVINKITDMEKMYSENYRMALDEISEDIVKYGTKAAVKAIGKKIPLLRDVDIALSTVSTYAKINHGTEVQAAKELLSLSQLDRALSRSFDIHAQRIRDGLADAEDIAQADKLFHMLKGMKIKEYQAMASLVEKGSDAYNDYINKLNQLQSMNSAEDFM